jgi:hypothetical protein
MLSNILTNGGGSDSDTMNKKSPTEIFLSTKIVIDIDSTTANEYSLTSEINAMSEKCPTEVSQINKIVIDINSIPINKVVNYADDLNNTKRNIIDLAHNTEVPSNKKLLTIRNGEAHVTFTKVILLIVFYSGKYGIVV